MKQKPYGMWFVRYKEKDAKEWKKLKTEKGYWYADPMLFTYKGKKYLFTEAFDMRSQIGRIAVSVYTDGCFSTPKVIIKKRYHLSYPCVFEYKSKVYMIPETSQNGTLELWEAGEDLVTWKRTAILLNKVKYADTTVLVSEEKIYLVSYEEKAKEYVTHIFELITEPLKVEKKEEIVSASNNKRPAGNFIKYSDDQIYRPVQNNVKMYGESMTIFRVASVHPFKEQRVCELTPEFFHMNEPVTHTHTLAYDDDLIVIDVQSQVYVSGLYRIINIRKFRNGIYKIIYLIRKS